MRITNVGAAGVYRCQHCVGAGAVVRCCGIDVTMLLLLLLLLRCILHAT